MKLRITLSLVAACLILSLAALSASAQSVPVAKEGDWVAKDFRFHTGEVMPELRLHYTHDRRAHRRAGAGAARHDRHPAPAC